MRFLHTADWHLGKVIYNRSLLPEQRRFVFDFLLPLIDEGRPDAVLIAGDLFDRAVAPAGALQLFDDFVAEVCAARAIPLCVITGNHDGANRIALGARLLRDKGFHIAARPAEAFTPVRFADEAGPVDLWMLPYIDPAAARELMGDEGIRTFADAYDAVLGRMREAMDPAARQLLMCHCFVAGGQRSESESPLYIGGSGEVPASVFEGFDYVALGHLHACQRIGEGAVYAGSPLPYSFDEEHQKKSVTWVSLEAGGITSVQTPVAGLRPMRAVTGDFAELRAAAKDDPGREDFISATLTDPGPVFEAMARLREHYPNILELRTVLSQGFAEDGKRGELRAKLMRRDTSDRAVFDAFLRQVCGREPDDETARFFEELTV